MPFTAAQPTVDAVAMCVPTSTMKSSPLLPYSSHRVPVSGTSVLSDSWSGTWTLVLSKHRSKPCSTACAANGTGTHSVWLLYRLVETSA
jgi:hypothetical protein